MTYSDKLSCEQHIHVRTYNSVIFQPILMFFFSMVAEILTPYCPLFRTYLRISFSNAISVIAVAIKYTNDVLFQHFEKRRNRRPEERENVQLYLNKARDNALFTPCMVINTVRMPHPSFKLSLLKTRNHRS